MPTVEGYQLRQLIHRGRRSMIYRAAEDTGGQSVVLKIPLGEYRSDSELAAQRRAFDLAQIASDRAIVRHLRLINDKSRVILVTEDFRGDSLDRFLQQHGRPDVGTALEIGAALARSLGELHAARIIHRDLTPANVLWNPGTRHVRMFDLTSSSQLQQGNATAQDNTPVLGSLVYSAPEQTGRTNQPIDARADLYSIGAILFELLTGSPPFPFDDTRELIHAHLARQPPDLAQLNPDLPASLPEIIAKLLAKNPDARYASAIGLANDLECALVHFRHGTASTFTPGAADVRSNLVLPNRIYGRESERAQLLIAINSAMKGERETVLVSGYSGIGKSALIHEVQLPVASRYGWFCSGKFDQFRRDVPYLGWRSILRSLVRQVLTESEVVLEHLRTELTIACAGNIALITQLVPELSDLISDQLTPPDVSAAEMQVRFIQAFRGFVRAIARSEHPLVVFVDDLQWADLASLQLFESLASDRTLANLLILGAYRDNEVNRDHPLRATIRAIQDGNHPLLTLSLKPLEQQHVEELISDTLIPTTLDISPLAQLAYGKTGGNPFFLRQFLTTLSRTGLLSFDYGSASWNWDLAAIDSEGYTDNVLDLVSRRIADLSPSSRSALEQASCLGTEFDLQTLARISKLRVSIIATAMDEATAEGLLIPLDLNHRIASTEARLAEEDGRVSTANSRFRFLHDRVQQTAHEGIPQAERAQLHMTIARERLANARASGAEDDAIDVMDHLSQSMELCSSATERLQFAEICLVAARKAKASMATGPAADYLALGRMLLPDDAWQSHPRLTLDLHIQSADIAYITERYQEAEELSVIALGHASAIEDRAVIHNIHIGIGVARRNYVEATRYGINVLRQELGVRIPHEASSLRTLTDMTATRWALRAYEDQAILNLPNMAGEQLHAAMEMMMKCATNAYWANQALVPIIAGHMLRLSLKHGKSGLTAYGLALFGMIVSQALNAVDFGTRIGALSMAMLERTGDRHLIGKTGLLWHGMIRHSKEPLRLCAADTLACYHHAMDAGDVENAAYCGTVAYYGDLLSGRPLHWVEERYHSYIPALLETAQEHTTLALQVWRQVVANLAEHSYAEPRAVGSIIDWPVRLAELLQEEGSDMAIATVAGGAGWLAFLLDDLKEAETQFAMLYEREQNALGQCFWKPCMALYAVVLARKSSKRSFTDRRRLVRLRMALNRWAAHNPHDFASFRTLLDAELHNSRNAGSAAIAAWTGAMDLAQDSGFLYIEAWAAEQAAEAHRRSGHIPTARYLNERARTVWRQQGIFARLRLLDDRLGLGDAAGDQSDGRQFNSKASQILGDTLTGLDFDAVLRAVQTLSESIEIDQLAAKILELSVLQAGARKGSLLIQQNDLRPFATSSVDASGKLDTQHLGPVQGFSDLPASLIDYVSRTGDTLLVEDAQIHEWLARDPFVIRHKCRSMLAVPLLRQGSLVGLIVLENELGSGMFLQADAAVVQTIAGQAAVSLENARLFESQKRQNEAFARFVPRPFLEHLGHKLIEEVRLGDAVERRVTVMFADLRGFTALSESMDITENFALLNAFIARMVPIIERAGGFIDEFTGDGFKALFINNPDGAAQAAIGIQSQLRRYNTERAQKGRPQLAVGVGVHSGQALLGTIGAEGRTSTTVIGDTVNTAARVEGLTKVFNTPSLISGATYDDLQNPLNLSTRMVGTVRVKGRMQPIAIYELIDARPEGEREILAATLGPFNDAIRDYYSRDFAKAARGFQLVLDQAPADLLNQYYWESASELLEKGVTAEWDGVIVRTDK